MSEEYVVLKHDEWEKILGEYAENPSRFPLGPAIWHIEPANRYYTRPPGNPHWKLEKTFVNSSAAYKFLAMQEAKDAAIIKEIIKKKRQAKK